MFDTALSRKLLKAAYVAGFLAVGATGALAQTPSFTLNPSAVGLNGTQFTANNIVVSDFATITYTGGGSATAGGSFTDNGFLPVAQFQTANGFITPTGLNTNGGYGLYFQFSGTGTQTALSGGSATGTFNNLSVSLYGFNQGSTTPTFNPNGTTTTGVNNPQLLATGSLVNGSVLLNSTANGIVPTANTLISFAPASGASAFFVSPNPFYVQLQSSFTNTTTQVTQTATGFTINQGGGSANFLPINTPVPEPASMLLLGAGLAGLGLVRRRKA